MVLDMDLDMVQAVEKFFGVVDKMGNVSVLVGCAQQLTHHELRVDDSPNLFQIGR